MKNNMTIQHFNIEHVERYGEIYAAAFSGEPWKDHWTVENAAIHVRELLESKTAYGLECIIDGKMVGIGKHYDLVRNCPVYQEIALSQLSKEELGL